MKPLEDGNAGKERVWRGACWLGLKYGKIWPCSHWRRYCAGCESSLSGTLDGVWDLWQSFKQMQCLFFKAVLTRGASVLHELRILLEPGQSHGLDQPFREKSSAESHTWGVWGVWLRTLARKEVFLNSLYQSHTFLKEEVQKRQSTSFFLWRNHRIVD